MYKDRYFKAVTTFYCQLEDFWIERAYYRQIFDQFILSKYIKWKDLFNCRALIAGKNTQIYFVQPFKFKLFTQWKKYE